MKTLLTTTFAILMIRTNARLIHVPEDATVAAGTPVTLRCGTDSTLRVVWKVHTNASLSRIVYTGTKIANDVAELYKISTPKQGTFNLEFTASRETALVYSCEEAGGNPVYAELKVFDSRRSQNVSINSFVRANYESVSDVAGETGGSSNNTATLITVVTCLVLLVMVVIALSGYIINIKRKKRNPGLSNCPTRESAASSDYVELPTKEGKCQRFTDSGDYSALRGDQYAKLEVYAVLDVKTEKE